MRPLSTHVFVWIPFYKYEQLNSKAMMMMIMMILMIPELDAAGYTHVY
jgi:hypothetical protein